eukprot:TRINITY_DN11968_c1_g2_i7.p2 TRINITY_DN11968_c1_g2~~TRINITY_DN11968_c1_g2_i7.p2  ORF type:complete len:312 (+),score=19.17 TRINITY_DN11968_c1_g2_i7:156-1091(+)
MQEIPKTVINEGWEDFWEFIKTSSNTQDTVKANKNDWEVIEASQMSLCGTEQPQGATDLDIEAYIENSEEMIIRKMVEDIFRAVQERADNAEWDRLTGTGLSRLGSQTTFNTESFSLISEAVTHQESDEHSLQRNSNDSSQDSLPNLPIVYAGVEPIAQSPCAVCPTLPNLSDRVKRPERRTRGCVFLQFSLRAYQVSVQVLQTWQDNVRQVTMYVWNQAVQFTTSVVEVYKRKIQTLRPTELYSIFLGMTTGGLLLSLYILQRQKALWRFRACKTQQEIMAMVTKMEELQWALLMSRYSLLRMTTNFENV